LPSPGPRVTASPERRQGSEPSPAKPGADADEAQTELDKVAEKNNLNLPKENEIIAGDEDFAIYAYD